MKKISIFLLIATLFFAGCDDDNGFYSDIKSGGVWMKMGDGMIVGTSDIDYYDASTCTFYLKKDLPYLKNVFQGGSFSVYVDNTEIYKCNFIPVYSSSIPIGTYAYCSPFMYPDFILSIGFSSFSSDENNTIKDPRNDIRIINALKKYGQYHEGLSFEIQSVTKMNDKIIMNAELYNPDTFDYYFLDPDKMGIGLFHYFTNGLSMYDSNNKLNFSNNETIISPEPWDSWDIKWMSLIKNGERKKITLEYNNFEEIPAGYYHVFFSFPGLSYQIKQKEKNQVGGRIWLGNIYVTKDFIIE